MSKVKAHNEANICIANALQTVGNIVADRLAEKGSSFNEARSRHVVSELEALDRTAALVVTRLTKIGFERQDFGEGP